MKNGEVFPILRSRIPGGRGRLRRWFNRAALGLMVVSVAVVIGGCAAEPSNDEVEIRRVILVVVDTLRGDHLGCAGGPVATPNLDALAARGVRFSLARTHIPITGPSHSSLFTGLLPSEHGVLNNTQVLAEDLLTLPELLRAQGMKTAAFISLGVLREEFGLNQGFENFDQAFKLSWQRNAGEVNNVLLPWLRTLDDSEPFFLWAHYSDPHGSYAAPGRPYSWCRVTVDGREVAVVEADGTTVSIPVALEDGRCTVSFEVLKGPQGFRNLEVKGIRSVPGRCRVTAGPGARRTRQKEPIFILSPQAELVVESEDKSMRHAKIRFVLRHHLSMEEIPVEYGHEVEYVDQQLGRLISVIEERDLFENSLIIFLSDHGEGLGDHRLAGHIDQLYDSQLHVPLIMVAPGLIPAGLVVDQPVSLVDVVPTIAELVGFSSPQGIRGRSLVPLMARGGELPDRPHVALTARPQADSDLEAVVVDGWKLIRKRETGQVALFDLGADPGELMDLAPQHPAEVLRLNRILDEHLATSISGGTWAELDDESRSRLEALGYVN